MKNKKTLLYCIIAIAVLITLIACFNPWNDEKGTIIINLGVNTNARSILPWPPADFDFLDDITHKITLTGNGQTIYIEVKGGGTIRQNVSLGLWNIKIDAWLEDVETPANLDRENVHYATGLNSIVVTPGQNTVIVEMNPICQDCGEYPCDCSGGIIPVYNYIVSFESIGGSKVDAMNIPHGSKIPRPADPALTGFTFDSWYKELEFQNKWNFEVDAVTRNITLFAKWITNICVGFPEHNWIWTANAIQQTCKEPSKDTAICSICQITNIRTGNLDSVGCNFTHWAIRSPAEFHDNETDVCGSGAEELRCVRFTQCGETNGTRFIPCPGTQGLVINTNNIVGDNRLLNVRHVCIPNRATSIASMAFGGAAPNVTNENIQSIRIGLNVTSIEMRAFQRCTNLNSVRFAEGNDLTSIGTSAFQDCFSLTSIIIPNSVTSIGNNTFAGCYSLTSVTLPNNLSFTTIADGMFHGAGLTSIIIPNSVTAIGSSAFNLCFSLTSITIPNSVTTIGTSAFRDCTDLRSITFERVVPPSFGTNTFTDSHSTLRIFVPAGSAAAYRAVANLNTWRNRIHSVGCTLDNPASGINCSCE
jgi:uncharacterized repeat protein (TIGR02543 family)